jgi:hypothetical protein
MSEEKPGLHIDNDWKRQAQEEKKRLIEEEAKKAKAPSVPASPAAATLSSGPSASTTAKPGAAGPARGRGERELPPAGFGALVQSILTQILYYLGDLSTRGGGEGQLNFDMAKYQLDMLNSLEDKTRGNLNDDEKQLLDTALYETRMRFVNVASQYIS